MPEMVPLALGCGHLATGFVTFEADDEQARVECPEGCGLVSFVAEPPGIAEPADLTEGDA